MAAGSVPETVEVETAAAIGLWAEAATAREGAARVEAGAKELVEDLVRAAAAGSVLARAVGVVGTASLVGTLDSVARMETAAEATARVERASVEAVEEARGVAVGVRAGSVAQEARVATVRAKVAQVARFHVHNRL